MTTSRTALAASAMTMAAALWAAPLAASAASPLDGPLVAVDETRVETLLQARVFTEDGASSARVARVDFGDDGALERVWIRFQPAFSEPWTIRALARDVAYAPDSQAVVVHRTEDQLYALAQTDPEFRAMSATRVSVSRLPISRLIGRDVIDEEGASMGVVAAVDADATGRATTLQLSDHAVIEWPGAEIFEVPAVDAFYLPVTDRILVLTPELEVEGPLAAAEPRCAQPGVSDGVCT